MMFSDLFSVITLGIWIDIQIINYLLYFVSLFTTYCSMIWNLFKDYFFNFKQEIITINSSIEVTKDLKEINDHKIEIKSKNLRNKIQEQYSQIEDRVSSSSSLRKTYKDVDLSTSDSLNNNSYLDKAKELIKDPYVQIALGVILVIATGTLVCYY
uniref:Uncharacterized protein n=1 Tax=Amanita phalloides TaxID=67723 RepID=A0A5Q0N4G6_AMAPH|nr:hypothetical protein [Amanita phalloides]QFZ98677.1 hypothetical protein [Amanita phalloides]